MDDLFVQCTRCKKIKNIDFFDINNKTDLPYKLCSICLIRKKRYNCRIRINVLKQKGQNLRSELFFELKVLYDLSGENNNYFYNLPLDCIRHIMKFVYGYSYEITLNKYQCDVCKKILTKSNRAKHMKLHQKQLEY